MAHRRETSNALIAEGRETDQLTQRMTSSAQFRTIRCAALPV